MLELEFDSNKENQTFSILFIYLAAAKVSRKYFIDFAMSSSSEEEEFPIEVTDGMLELKCSILSIAFCDEILCRYI